MSSTGRGADYTANAAYNTPLPLARTLVDALPCLDEPGLVLEPSVGSGAFVLALLERDARTGVRHDIEVMDIDPAAPGLHRTRQVGGVARVGDFLLPYSGQRRPRVVLGNPPFGETRPGAKPIPAALRHVQRAIELVGPGGHVAMLLRLSMLAGQARLTFWQAHPARHIWVIADRPDFTGGGGDSADYAFIWWEVGWSGPTTLSQITTLRSC